MSELENDIRARASRLLDSDDEPAPSRSEILAEMSEVIDEIETRWPHGEPEAPASEVIDFNLRHTKLIVLELALDRAVDPKPVLGVIQGGRDGE